MINPKILHFKHLESMNIATLTIQSICLSITILLIFIRAYQMYQNRKELLKEWQIGLTQCSQFIMLIGSFIYILPDLNKVSVDVLVCG